MKNQFRRGLVACVVILTSLFNSVAFVYAADLQSKVEPDVAQQPLHELANLTMDPLQPVALGDHPVLVLHLTNEYGKPIHGQPILIFVNGKRKAIAYTDNNGTASVTLRYKFEAGTYKIRAVYPGVPELGFRASAIVTDMVVEPSNATLYTVPPVAGVNFKFNNEIYTTDEKGTVTFKIDKSGMYPLELLPFDEKAMPPDVRMEFARWNDNVFTPYREIYFPRDRRLEIGFIFKYEVDQIFYDAKGALVDPARVSSITLRGVGHTYTFDHAGPQWLPSNRLARRIGERLESQDILYYFRDVTIDGANVINKSEQRFHIRPNDTWSLNVLLYSTHFSAKDAMFHFPMGRGIELTYPDGHKQEFLFESAENGITVPALARGSYTVKVISQGGSAPPTPLYVSKDQNAELLVLSYLDMAVIFGLPLAFALLLLFKGRPHLYQLVRHPARLRELVYQSHRDNISLEG